MINKLLTVKFQTLRGTARSRVEGRYRAPFFTIICLLFWKLEYAVSKRVFAEVLELQPVGELLVQKLMSIGLLAIFGLLIFSNIVTVFSTLYLADDLDFLMSKPIPHDSLFIARFVESLTQASWIVLIFGSPIFIAAGVSIGASIYYYLALMAAFLPFVAIPTCFAVIFALLTANLLRPSRTRDVALLAGVTGFAALYYLIRALRPERLLSPENFQSIGELFELLTMPTFSYLPSDWLIQILSPLLFDSGSINFMAAGLLVSTPLALFFVATWLHRAFYMQGYSNIQEGRQGKNLLMIIRDHILRWTSKAGRGLDEELAHLQHKDEQKIGPLFQLIHKDHAVFTRDATQWSQLLVVLSIITIYLVNFKYFDMAADESLVGQVNLYVINMLVCGFSIVALAGRFLFPSVSTEGRSFWLIVQAPISLDKYLIGKWLGVMPPILVLSQFFIWTSNLLIGQHIIQCLFASAVILMLTLCLSAMAVGMGAMFPQFHNPNAAKIASSFGAVIFMILAMFLLFFILGASFRTAIDLGRIFSQQADWDILGIRHLIGCTIAFILPVAIIGLTIKLGARSLRARF